jgi:hypothetical protein
VTLSIQAKEFNLGFIRPENFMVWESLGSFWQTPSGLSCAFYWGVASIWPFYHSWTWWKWKVTVRTEQERPRTDKAETSLLDMCDEVLVENETTEQMNNKTAQQLREINRFWLWFTGNGDIHFGLCVYVCMCVCVTFI